MACRWCADRVFLQRQGRRHGVVVWEAGAGKVFGSACKGFASVLWADVMGQALCLGGIVRRVHHLYNLVDFSEACLTLCTLSITRTGFQHS